MKRSSSSAKHAIASLKTGIVPEKRESAMQEHWLKKLEQLVRKHPLAVLRLDSEQHETLSSQTSSETISFSIALPRATLRELRVPTACLLITEDHRGKKRTYFGSAVGKSPVTTFESRLMIGNARPIAPDEEESIIALVTDKHFASDLRRRLGNRKRLVCLSPMLSVHLVKKLAEVGGNKDEMRRAASGLEDPPKYSDNKALQQDAVNSALRVFRLTPHDTATSVETEGPTALGRVPIREDAVIEHDARHIPEFALTSSDLTGRAVFEKGRERLEVITANRNPLEEVFGVDLIYLNLIKRNIVMVQYKMLEPTREDNGTDWIYRPDDQFGKQINRMKSFRFSQPPEPYEYRINPQAFYLKFVRRDASLGKSPITMPIDHFEVLQNDPACIGPRGAFRISFDALDGRYLRQTAFFDLIRSGYIGAYAQDTKNLEILIEEILKDNRAVVAATASHSQLPLHITDGDLYYG